MRDAVNRIVVWSASVLFLYLLAAAPAAGQTSKDGLFGGWIPSLGVTAGALFQNQDSSVESMCAVGGYGFPPSVGNCTGFANGIPTPGPGPAPLRPSDSGSDTAVAPYVGANLQLLTPEIPVPTRPRFFVLGEVLPTFATDRKIAGEGNPKGVEVPTNVTGLNAGLPKPPTQFFQNEFLGVGSATLSTYDTWAWAAGAGLAFPFELYGHRLWLKPSVGWLQYEMQVEGTLEQGLKDDTTTTAGPNTRQCTFLPNATFPTSASCSGISLSGSQSKRFNGIGPGLELELDAARWGPVGASIYIDFRAYKILGNRDVTFSADSGNTYNTATGRIPADTYTADWSFSVDPWMFRGGLGVRFSWLGK